MEIPKPDGGIRTLGVPTAIDRLLQQAVSQVLTPIYEPTFSDSSFGFRPNRSAQDAILRARGYMDEGYRYAHDYAGNFTDQEFLPEGLSGTVFYHPGNNPKENEIRSRMERLWPKYKEEK